VISRSTSTFDSTAGRRVDCCHRLHAASAAAAAAADAAVI